MRKTWFSAIALAVLLGGCASGQFDVTRVLDATSCAAAVADAALETKAKVDALEKNDTDATRQAAKDAAEKAKGVAEACKGLGQNLAEDAKALGEKAKAASDKATGK